MFAIMHLPLLGMGTWGMGGKFDTDESNFDASVEALRFGFEQGIRLVDVAELHGGGLTERIVGEAIKGYTREDIQIISKVSRDHPRRQQQCLQETAGGEKATGCRQSPPPYD